MNRNWGGKVELSISGAAIAALLVKAGAAGLTMEKDTSRKHF